MNLRDRLPFIAVIATSALCIGIAVYCLKSGIFIVFQNLFYLPIIIACFYYRKWGFVFSVVLAGIYLLLFIAFTGDQVIVWDALIRVMIFILVAAVITALSIARARGEEALTEEREKFRTVADFTYNWEYWTDPQLNILYISPACERITGYRPEEFLANSGLLPDIAHPADRQIFKDHAESCHSGREHGMEELDFRIMTRHGEERWIAHICQPVYGRNGQFRGRRVSNRDITEERRTRASLQQSEERFKNLFQESPIPTFTWQKRGGDFFLVDYNQAALQITKGKVCNMLGRSALDLYKDRPQILGDMKSCFEEQSIVRRELTSRHFAPGRQMFVHYAFVPPDLIIVHTEDQTERKEGEQKLQEAISSLRKAVLATVQVMVAAVETRDPYTAGHQVRSADLARAIAKEMGLPQDKIDGIRMAGSIHDIGKLAIPVEILTKPKKLSDMEFSLIKLHARKGYEMLKHVASPWPLAEIVHQHHERMNGSGYPRGLKGEEIILEARILAVADVVESMASHRPYRPALGLAEALAEIELRKGELYDANAADACLRLFREKNFRFEETRS